MVVFAAQGDPRRSMTLLWRPRPEPTRSAPGPKPALSVDGIVDAAVALADAEGMAAVSMRAIGDRLGRTGMALYTYVPGKGELVDLMYDRVHAELPTRYPTDAHWRVTVRAWAEDLWSCYLRHPWVLQVSQARPVLGPHEFTMLDTLVSILRGTDLPPTPLRRISGTLVQFVRATAQTVAETRQAPNATGMPDDEWWYARSGVLSEVAPDFATRFPHVSWLESEGAYQLDDPTVPYLEQEARETFVAGLDALLDGIEVAIDRTAR
ncbi:TetR/AcrR family transcriptional regulator [Plantactinospora sp. GCM10030261]|uniref:TetR/AcrR family transcriptional regulator n=1 Tax=Plantactinospora sp. GCM10030261 TaxID=3273420 RepID=UPI00361BB78D